MDDKERRETILRLFDLIRGTIVDSDVAAVKKYVIVGLQDFKKEDDYIKSLVVQLLCVGYIRLYELINPQDGMDIFRIDSQEIGLEGQNVLLFMLSPTIIAMYFGKVKELVNERVKKKIDYMMKEFTRVPCVSAYHYNHLNEEYTLNPKYLYSKEKMEELMPFNKSYAQYFYIHMFEYFNAYAVEEGKKALPIYTAEKWLSMLNDVEQGLDKILKGIHKANITDTAFTILLNFIYRYDHKEITLKSYYILEEIVKHIVLVKKLPHLKWGIGMYIYLDIDFLRVIKDVAKENNSDVFFKTVKLENSYKKLASKVGNR